MARAESFIRTNSLSCLGSDGRSGQTWLLIHEPLIEALLFEILKSLLHSRCGHSAFSDWKLRWAVACHLFLARYCEVFFM